MKILLRVVFLFLIAFEGSSLSAASIVLDEKDATVWLPLQSIAGKADGVKATSLTVYCNGTPYKVKINADKTFSVNVKLNGGENKIWAADQTVTSAALRLTLGYEPLPVVKPVAEVGNNNVKLNAKVIDNPLDKPITYLWTAAKNNPAACLITERNTSSASVNIPFQNGTYYFDLLAMSGKNSSRFSTYVVRNGNQLHPYRIDQDHAAWIDSAIIYEITPSSFVQNGTYGDIEAKLPEIKGEGINTIWLQPLCQTLKKQQGYDVTDYFSLRDDLGTELQLKNLINTAKKLNMRVLFDFVPNHTSIHHPYAQDCIKYGKSSHYYNFYQRVNDGKPYSSFYKKNADGFYTYFWDDLVNLDYNNPEVQQWIIQAVKYWLLKFDIDGYRFDAMWAVNARSPSFSKRLATELKSIKPDILLLGEDKPFKSVSDGFDAAYDWTADTAWISQWAWQTHYSARKNLTIFNSPDTTNKCRLMRKALFNQNAKVVTLKFMENNDVPRFIAAHDLVTTKQAAALLFSLPGIPMLYNGQEVGCKFRPYSGRAVFDRNSTIATADSLQLLSYYKKLLKLRAAYPALRAAGMEELPLPGSKSLIAFQRRKNDEQFVIILNLSNTDKSAAINLNGSGSVVDVLVDKEFTCSDQSALTADVPVDAHGIRWLLFKKKA